ncbi:MAG: COX15/CtaA family protein [Cyanobacteriota bacterium]|nr:COX15/CtaA family protein [Cyanobacteriota bacterium]
MSVVPSLKVLTSHLVVALVALVVVGGATRVMEAGLACPDWPLCYGVLLPGRQMNMRVFLEWFHRLDAFFVGMALLALLLISLWRRHQLPPWLPWMSLLATALVAIQGGLGALTVTHLLAPSMVTAHLATALLLVTLVSALDQGLAGSAPRAQPAWWLPLALLPTALVLAQCVLGGLMASQWAVDHCFSSGSQCEWVARHRQLAMPAALSVMALAGCTLLTPAADPLLRGLTTIASVLVGVQVSLGLLTLHSQLQLPLLTVTHQLLAALLVALLGAVVGRLLVSVRQPSPPVALEVPRGQ